MRLSLPLSLLCKDLLKIAGTTKEVKHILNKSCVVVDGKPRFTADHPIGYMDVITLKETKQHFRVMLDDKGRLFAKSVPAKEAQLKLCKIRAKTSRPEKVTQLGFTDGRTLRITKDTYKVGDGVVLDMAKNEIAQHLPLDKGVLVQLTAGRHIGKIGSVERIEGRTIHISAGEEKFTTPRRYAFVLGAKKPAIEVANQA
jgi:small subunit ribosomal protein S4e